MQKYISLFFSVLLYLTACKSNDVPDGIIKEKEMISLLTDVHVSGWGHIHSAASTR
jgi:hypothetical protein